MILHSVVYSEERERKHEEVISRGADVPPLVGYMAPLTMRDIGMACLTNMCGCNTDGQLPPESIAGAFRFVLEEW